ncbi:MAG: hypothetical protein JWR24_2798 [Actinoallomurus sp.]|jgi:hypothetical protein|nr:hypothetical protein [Actinoallomurus sp.]
MGLKTMVLAGTALATMTIGFTAPAFAAPAFAATQAAPQVVPPPEQPEQAMAVFPGTSGQQDDGSDDVSGLAQESPVCSALGAESIPTGDVVAKCTSGGGAIE